MTIGAAASIILAGMVASVAGGADGRPASAEKTVRQAPNFYRFTIGDYVVTALSDGTATVPWDTVLQGMPPTTIRSIFADHGETVARDTSINAFLIDTGTRRILIDAGAGSLFGDCCGRLPAVLAEAGYPAETIDMVLLTHVHGDHSGGLTVGGRRTFPKATVHLARREYDYWMSDAEEARAPQSHKKMFAEGRAARAPYAAADRLRFFRDGEAVVPGITTIPAPGHTPGHTFYRLARGDDSVVFVGDIVHAAEVQFGHPHVTAAFDVDQPQARATREQALAAFARTHELVAADHVSFPGIGHIVRAGQGYVWSPQPYRAVLKPARQ